jgi:hypothetical protein
MRVGSYKCESLSCFELVVNLHDVRDAVNLGRVGDILLVLWTVYLLVPAVIVETYCADLGV